MSTLSPPAPVLGEQRLLLRSIEWSAYRQIAEALKGRHVRLTYDRGSLEFMTISPFTAIIAGCSDDSSAC
jgi:hypothetical protein